MPPIRVLIVDDSVVIRKILSEALSSDPAIEVAATAADGRIALSKISQVNPDLITLDIEMPGWNGLETLVEIRKLHPKLPIIMFSTLTERGASATLEALSLGASDYATKPSNTGRSAAESARTELIPKIKALCGLSIPEKAMSRLTLPPMPRSSPRPLFEARIDVLAIGTSTGGPNALSVVLPALPADFPVPIVIVQHMPPIFTRLLAERLSKGSQICVREGEPEQVLEPGAAWIAPGGYHMVVKRQGTAIRIALNQEAPENSCRPSVDVLFRSVAQTYGSHALGVVMTGMGADGVLGSRYLREAGGEVIVQDEASSTVWGMPGLVAAAGQADGIYPLDQLGPQIARQVRQSRSLFEIMRGGERQESFS